ncbi:MAG: DUF2333 family protein [Alphaproteobacteria bacterium]
MTNQQDHQPATRGAGARAFAIVAAATLALVAGFPAAMYWIHDIDDDPANALPAGEPAAGGSRAVAMVAALVARETDEKRWVANDPWFMPGHWLDNMPNFQQGMFAALARVTAELRDQLGRARGTSQDDGDLREAAGLLQFPGDKWVIDLATSPWPQAPSEAQYRRARQALLAYNRRLAAGQAVFARRADNLIATLDRIALDLGSSAAALDQRIGHGVLDMRADDLFFSVKGQAHGYALVLRELEKDFAAVVRERDVGTLWRSMLASLAHAASMDPLVVVNAAPDGTLFPSHLAAQGFYLLRARVQMREIAAVLAK